jgi:DNA invertase Pin-like site-specific DNA recombinase
MPVQNRHVKYGYARVSTATQDYDAQVKQLIDAGAQKVFAEKITGTKIDRDQLKRAIAALDPGDVLSVTRIDRLARNTRDLLNIIHEIQGCGAGFMSLAEPWANTDSPTAKAVLTILGAVAELERSFILARTASGREAAKAKGRHGGRKKKLTAEQIAFTRELRDQGKGRREIARLLNVDGSTVSRALQAADA